MSIPSAVKHTPIGDRQQLADYFAAGEKPPEAWRIGTEHEKFGFLTDTLRPPTFEGDRGIKVLLETLATRYGWDVAREGENPVALSRDKAAITLEPAGQLELSGAPLETVHETCREVNGHLAEVRSIADDLGMGFLGMGFQPKWRRDEMPWMPKGRYKIMREYMPKVGSLGLDMMTRTCTVQVNLDFGSQADMIKKFRVGLALQPIATALFADSPFTEGRPNGYQSYRSEIWTDTDKDRTGMLDFVFDDSFGYERYVDYLLDVPMYFSLQHGQYVDLAGQDFKQFMAGKLPMLPGVKANMTDFADHLTTVFPEVRLKQFLEMRGADGGPWNRLCALPAFWVGLLYDQEALDAAWDLVKDFTREERHVLRDGVPKQALKLPFRGAHVRELAEQALKIAAHGLKRRARLNDNGADESIFLQPLLEIVHANQTPAERKLELFYGAWNGSVDPIFTEFAY
ncbi:MAG: glutamate--cysteine ligase [Rhodanobacter sp.]